MIPDNVEKIIMTKEDYDRNVEQLLVEKLELEQELQRKDNIINKAIKMCEEDAEAIWEYEGAYSDMFELIKDVLQEKEIKELEENDI